MNNFEFKSINAVINEVLWSHYMDMPNGLTIEEEIRFVVGRGTGTEIHQLKKIHEIIDEEYNNYG